MYEDLGGFCGLPEISNTDDRPLDEQLANFADAHETIVIFWVDEASNQPPITVIITPVIENVRSANSAMPMRIGFWYLLRILMDSGQQG